jgi:hypothetical protein
LTVKRLIRAEDRQSQAGRYASIREMADEGENGLGPPRCTIILVSLRRQRADELIKTHRILRAGRKSPANPVQTPCQKQHGPLHNLYAFIIA